MPDLAHRVYMVGAFPPPVHGMAAINNAVRTQLERMGVPFVKIDIAAPCLDRSLPARFARLPKAVKGMLRFGIRARCAETLYMSVSGGLGQLYEVLFLLLARLHNMRIFMHHHSYAYLNKRNALTCLLVSIAGSSATHITLSTGMARRLRDTYYQARRIVAISNVTLLIEEDKSSVVPHKALVKIGFIGNISTEKGVFEFLDVLEKMEETGSPVQALLAGPFQNVIIERLVQRRLTQLRSVEYVGPKYGSDKVAFFRDIDVLLFPTKYSNEAEPLTIHEAMMFGVPVIAYGRGAIGEVLSPDCGLVIDPEQDFVIPAVEQLQMWRGSPRVFEKASKCARERFLTIFTNNKKRWESMLAELCV